MGPDGLQDTLVTVLARCDDCRLWGVERPPCEFASVAFDRREKVAHQVAVAAAVDYRLCVAQPDGCSLRAGASEVSPEQLVEAREPTVPPYIVDKQVFDRPFPPCARMIGMGRLRRPVGLEDGSQL